MFGGCTYIPAPPSSLIEMRRDILLPRDVMNLVHNCWHYPENSCPPAAVSRGDSSHGGRGTLHRPAGRCYGLHALPMYVLILEELSLLNILDCTEWLTLRCSSLCRRHDQPHLLNLVWKKPSYIGYGSIKTCITLRPSILSLIWYIQCQGDQSCQTPKSIAVR